MQKQDFDVSQKFLQMNQTMPALIGEAIENAPNQHFMGY